MVIVSRKVTLPKVTTAFEATPQQSWQVYGSPNSDYSPSTDSAAGSPVVHNAAEARIAWTAYQGCSRRMNSACVANRSQTLEEQQIWWEETSSICLNAMLLHNASLNKQYHPETARNLQLLEGAYDMVQAMLTSVSSRQTSPVSPVARMPDFHSPPSSMSCSPTTSEEDFDASRASKRRGFSLKLGKFTFNLTTKGTPTETSGDDSESMLWG